MSHAWVPTLKLLAVNLQAHYLRRYEYQADKLGSDIRKYEEAIRYYEEDGKELANELSRHAAQSYDAGEIDFFRFVQSMDRATGIELRYLEQLFEYNKLILDLNYLTL